MRFNEIKSLNRNTNKRTEPIIPITKRICKKDIFYFVLIFNITNLDKTMLRLFFVKHIIT